MRSVSRANRICVFSNSDTLEKYPSWPKGHPWKGCRSLIAARGFKSLLLRLKSKKRTDDCHERQIFRLRKRFQEKQKSLDRTETMC